MKKVLFILCFFSFMLTAFHESTPPKSIKIHCVSIKDKTCSMLFDGKDNSFECNCLDGRITIGQIENTDDLSIVLPYLEYFKMHIQQEYECTQAIVDFINVDFHDRGTVVNVQYQSPITSEVKNVLYNTNNKTKQTTVISCINKVENGICLVIHNPNTDKVVCECENASMQITNIE